MKTHEKKMKSYIGTGLASLAVIFCVTVLADDPDRRKSTNRSRGGADMDAIRKRIDAGVRSGKIKREDAAKMLEGLRKRMETAKRGEDDRKKEGESDPRKAKYQAAERELGALVRARKISREEAGKRLEGLRKQLWSADKKEEGKQDTRQEVVR